MKTSLPVILLMLFLHTGLMAQKSYNIYEDAINLANSKDFTLGALFNDKTELELDLNQQPGYPEDFYWKD